MGNVLTEIIELLVGGIEGIATGIGSGLNGLVENIFLNTVEGVSTLSTFGAVIIVFFGVSLAIGLSRWVVSFLTSAGK